MVQKSTIETGVDKLVELVSSKGKISMKDAAKELAARRAARSARLAEVVAWTNTMVREIRAARVAAIQAKVKAETLAAREAAKQNVRTAVLTGRSNARALAIEAVIRNRAARSVE